MNLEKLCANIQRGEDGIWHSAAGAVRYPAAGNQFCFEVEDGSYWFQHRNQCLIELLRRFPPRGTFFDIGGGNGFTALALQKAGFGVVLVEPGPDGASNARRRGVRDVICSTFEAAEFQDASIAAAGAFDVLEHIEDDAGFLGSLHRCLQPGARLYLTVPAMRLLWSQEDEDAGHCRRYSLGSLRRLLESCRFHVEYATYVFQFLPPAILLARTIPWRLGFRRSPAEAARRERSEHGANGGALRDLARFLLKAEVARVRSGRMLHFGSSCLAVARRD